MLTGPEQLEWTNALFNAFSDQEFSDLLLYRLDDSIRNYSNPLKTSKTIVGDVVGAYSRREWEYQLIAKAIEARPGNSALLRLASTKKVAAAPDDSSLQRLIRDTNSFLNFSSWLDQAGKLQVRVCRIEILAQGGGTIFGTGFLVAADMVMTNWHVVRCIVAEEDNDTSYTGARAKASAVTCRFDYKVLPNGLKSEGATFTLAKDWRVALSPNNPSDREPQPDELDCAVIRLAEAAGNLPVGDPNGQQIPGDLRGWIQLPAVADPPPDFKTQSPLFIIEHPSGNPISLALDTDAVQSVNANRTRVRYATNTEAGSSGSPCFDQNWNLIALHHSGDPNFAFEHNPTYNQGIPIDAIVSYLGTQGFTELGKTE